MKFIDSDYDGRISTVTIQHLGNKFRGQAICHEDEEAPSEYTGCTLADFRAQKKALQWERRNKKFETDTIIKFLHSCECYSQYDPEDNTAKVMHRQLNKRIDQVNKLTDEINKLTEEIKFLPERRDTVLKGIARRKERKRAEKDNSNE